MEDPQADGYTPRLSASMLKTGNYNGKIVSIVGKFVSDLSFRCCDGELVDLSTEHAAIENLDREVAVEVVGQVSSPNLIAVFVVRELSKDMDLAVYNRMLEVQHTPKYSHYLAPVGA